MASPMSKTYENSFMLECTDKDWYHGELTRDQAEVALRANGSNCFLIRESKGNLVLSLIHHGQLFHTVIECRSGWYSLKGKRSQGCFNNLSQLVSFCCNIGFSATDKSPVMKLGAICKKADDDYIDVELPDIKASQADYTRYDWYHETITEDQAIAVLHKEERNCFLVRKSAKDLVLSTRLQGWVKHFAIHYTLEEGYWLNGKEITFDTIPALIAYYQSYPVEGKQLLGISCNWLRSKSQPKHNIENEVLFKNEVDLLRVNWRKCADLPVPMSAPQVVRIGDSVYAGGGFSKPGDGYAIVQYNLSRDSWTSVPLSPTYQHGLTQWRRELVVIGGKESSSGTRTNKVYTFRNHIWVEVFPPMPRPRSLLSAASHEDRLLIAAGGVEEVKSNGEFMRTDVVEIYVRDKQWCTTKRLPFPMSSFSICITDNKCYTLGGYAASYKQVCTTLYTTLSSLLRNAQQVNSVQNSQDKMPVIWKTLQDQHPLALSSIVEMDGELTALGGALADRSFESGTKIISTYDFQSNSWVECKGAELPLAIYNTGVVKLADDEVMVIGGGLKNQIFSAKVYIGKFENSNV